MQQILLRMALLIAGVIGGNSAYAALSASVSMAPNGSGSYSANIYPGDTTYLQVTLSNSGSTTATGVTFSHVMEGTGANGLLVAGTPTYTCTTAAGVTSTGGGTLTATTGQHGVSLSGGVVPPRAKNASNIDVDGYCSIILPVTVQTYASAGNDYNYLISAGSVTGDGGLSNTGGASQSVHVNSVAQPTISKSFNKTTLFLGGSSAVLTITATNSNPVALSGFSLTDAFPTVSGSAVLKVAATPGATASCNNGGASPTFSPVAGATSITMSGSLPAASGGTSGSCTFTVNVEAAGTADVYALSSVTNTIPATNLTTAIGVNASADASASVAIKSPLRVTKVFNNEALANGGSSSLTITLYNDGSTPLTNVYFDDNPIDGISGTSYGLVATAASTTCAGGAATVISSGDGIRLTGATIPAGGSCTVSANFTGTVQTSGVPITYENTLNEKAVKVTGYESTIISQKASASIVVADGITDQLTVNKTAWGLVNVPPGNPVRFSVTVTNKTAAALSNVNVSDVLADGMQFVTGVIDGVDYTPQFYPAGQCSGVASTVTSSSALWSTNPQFTLSTVPANGNCQLLFFAMTPTTASSSTVTNNIPAGSVCYGSGSSRMCNGTGSSTSAGTTTSPLAPSDAVVKTFDAVSSVTHPEGTVSTMKIVVKNYSVRALTNLSISDTLPSSSGSAMRVATPANASTTCGGTLSAVPGNTSVTLNSGTVPGRGDSGQSVTPGSCYIQVDVVGSAGTYNNVATVTSTASYLNGGSSTVGPVSSNTATLVYTSALSATKSFSPLSVSSGGTSTVTVRLSNSSTTPLNTVSVTDPLPTGMVLASTPKAYSTCAGSPSFTAVAGASTITMTGATIAANSSCDMLFDVKATGSANWINTIPVGSITAESGTVKNVNAVSGTLQYAAPTSLVVVKTTSPNTLTFPGEVSRLTITVTNGSQAVSNMSLRDYFTVDGSASAASNGMKVAPTPAVSTTCPGGIVSATPGGTSVLVSGVVLAANASCQVALNVTSEVAGSITNYIPSSSITSDQGLSNSNTATTSLATQNNLGVTKQFTPNVVKPGNRSRLRLTFYNPTGLAVSSLQVTDTMPAGVTIPSGPNPTTTCTGATVSSPAADQVRVEGASLPATVNASCYAEIDVYVAAQNDYTNVIPAGDVSALSGASVVKNSQPTSDVLRARQPIVVHKAITSLTLDSGNPAGFTTGSASTTPGTAATLTIRLTNPNVSASSTDGSLNAVAFTDTLPTNLVIAPTPNASTTCSGALLLASASGTTIRLSGATIAAGASCDVQVDVLSNTPGSYTNTIAAGALYSYEGVTNEDSTSAKLVVSSPPAVAKQFSPAVMASGGKSTLTIYLNNSNTTAATLTSDLVDTLPNTPGVMTVKSPNGLSTTCPGTVSAPAGGTTVTYPTGAQVPAGGCSISVDVTATTAGDYTNYIPVGALKTTHGFNQTQANATVSVSAQGFISGRVFQDNSVTPDGVYQAGTDAPLSGISLQLRSGSTCAGTLQATGSTDSQGTYLFSGLAAGTYSVCQTAQPSGTVNGITTAGTIQTVNGSTGTAGSASNPTTSTSQIVGIVLNGGGSGGEISGAVNNNFAEVVQSTVSGQVFLDQNNNGVLNAADSGISGVAIQLLNSSGTVVASTTTDSSGNYSFANLNPGTYSILEPTQPSGTSNGLTVAGSVGNGGSAGTVSGVTTLPSRISTLILPPNTTSTGNNFAEIPNTRTVSGKVFLDVNGNGAFNTGTDSGISAQVITLTGNDINGNPVSLTATTAADGSYIFNAVPEGSNYTLNQSAQPSGTVNGITTAGSAGGTASNPTTTSSRITGITLTGSTTVSSDNNFAETPVPPSVGKQFSPAVISAGDKSVLTIYLTNTTPVAATLTSALVDTLPTTPGPLVVATPNNLSTTCPGSPVAVAGSGTVTYPSGATLPAGGCTINVDVTTTTSGNYVNTIPVGALQTTLGNNAAAATAPLQVNSKGYISGRVFQDNSVTPDGIYQAGTDTPLAGVSIELRSGANCSGSLVSTTTTDSVGNYLFSLLSAGTYSVCQPSQPSGSINGITTAGSIVSVSGSTGSAGAASNPTSTSSQIAGIVLNANGGGTAISGSINNNFAEVVQSTISGTVFRDQNNNGVQNAGDTGIAGVTVQLLNASNTVVATTTTDASGNYSFANLNPGTYSIVEPTQPADTSNGVTVAGSVGNGGTAGTASATTTLPSRISTLVLPPNTTSSGNNFAEIANNRTLSGRVFLDYNNNGSFNSGTDQGLGGQVITLTGNDINGNPVSLTTTTASDGTYTFSNVPEGSNYTLTQGSQPAGTSNGTTTAGTAGGTGSNPSTTTSRITGINLSGSTTGSANNNFAEIPGAIPDLAISKTHTPSSFGDGSTTGAFVISPSNVGQVATSGTISVVDTMPAGLTPTSASGTGWACAIAGQLVTCTSSNVIAAAGSGNPITIKVKVGTGLVGNTLVNTAVISGGGEPAGFESNNTATDSVAIVASASVSGHVWRDTNHNRALDSGETVLAGWGVELVYNGSVIASTTSDASGAYSFTSLSPGSGYQIRFREPKTGTIFGYPVPNEGGSSYTNGVVSTANPTGANTSTGVLDGMVLTAGENVVQQSLPVDPSGVVYDAVTRKPVSGAVVTISGPSGFTESMVVGGSATQTTSTDGIYQFLLTSTAPAGVYTLTITSYPSGYQASTLIPVCSNVLTVGSTPSPALVQNSNDAPATSATTHNAATCPSSSSGLASTAGSTQFYFSFVLTPGVSASVINNHIPLDPLSGGSIVVTKTTPKLNVTRGEMVPYTITATNSLSTAAPNITVRDLMPPGFKYRVGSATLNGSHLEPTVAGRTLSWANQTFAGSEKKTYRLILTVGTGVSEGKYVNTAWALNGLTGNSVSNTATATVQVVPDPTFDCSDIIGKVFDDRNTNGYQDEGEPGIPNVRIATVRGLLVTSDADGRFHVACADIPQMDRGSNFIMKLDERTLPSGYRLTTENPRVVRTTRGKMVKLNFGAAIHKVFRLDVDQRAYTDNGEQLREPWAEQLRLLVLQLQERPAVLRLAYHVGPDEAEEDARKRQERLSDWIQRLYAERPRQESDVDQPQDKERKIPPLVIEMETVAAKGGK